MLNFIKFTLWPIAKVKLIYWWWIIKYGGKKNIPPDLIFKQKEEYKFGDGAGGYKHTFDGINHV